MDVRSPREISSSELFCKTNILPFQQIILYFRGVAMFKCRNGLAPSYLSSKFIKVSIIIKRLGLLLPIIWLFLGFLYDHIWQINYS